MHDPTALPTAGIRHHRLHLPLSEADVRRLRAGDLVTLDGEIVVTAGLPTHQRLIDCLDGKEALPMPLAGGCLFHIGSYSQDGDAGLQVRYINPTTSTRFNPYMPRLIESLSLRAVGGKGGLDAASAQAMARTGCVYLSFLGGGACLLTEAVREVMAVGWPDMLTHYRLVRLRVQGLGPATVGIDAHGRSLYDEQTAAAHARREQILSGLAQARKTALPPNA